MGKVFVIKGADFTANSIGTWQTANEHLVQMLNNSMETRKSMGATAQSDSSITLSKSSSAFANRARIWSVDLGKFISAGLTELAITTKEGWGIVALIGHNLTAISASAYSYIEDKVVSDWKWRSGTFVAPFDDVNNQFYLHIRKQDNSTIPDVLSIDDVFESVDIR